MKRLITIAILIVSLVASMAIMASAADPLTEGQYIAKVVASGTNAYQAGITFRNVKTQAWSPAAPNGPNDNGFCFLVQDTPVASYDNLYSAGYSVDATSWTFACFVDNAASNPDLTFNVYGTNAANIAPIVGLDWNVYLDGVKIDTFRWSADNLKTTTVDNPAYSYTFSDTTDMVGFANAKFITIEAVPEPAGIVAMLTGIVGLGGFAIRRRK